MIARDIEGRTEIGYWREQLVCVARVLTDHLPFLWRQRAGLEQDAVRNSHLADIVQGSPALHMDQFGVAKAEAPCQPKGPIGHALRMSFRIPVAQIQSAGPAFNGR